MSRQAVPAPSGCVKTEECVREAKGWEQGPGRGLQGLSQEDAMLFGRTETIELRVEGMTCGHCEQAVKRALEALPGVKEAQVSAAKGVATVKAEPGRFDRDRAAKAIEEAGYKLK